MLIWATGVTTGATIGGAFDGGRTRATIGGAFDGERLRPGTPGSVGTTAWRLSPHCWQYAKPSGVAVAQRGQVIVPPTPG
jgi:hypothetical protein